MLKPAVLFQDHMILQREKSIPVWGTANAKESVTVSIQGQQKHTLADKKGKWCVEIGPLRTSFSETMTISSDSEGMELKDVQIGEVWLAAGQSNMEFYMRYDTDYTKETEVCDNDNVRFFDYPEVSYPGQIDEADYGKNFGFWRKAAPDQLQWFSAPAYYFAKTIQAKYHIPVGLVGCNWGGTPACAWMSEQAIHEGGGQVYLDEYRAAMENLDLAAYDENFRANPGNFRTDPFADPISVMLMEGMSFEEILKTLYGQAPDLSQMDFSAMIPAMGPKNETRPCGLYESMLCQVAPYGLRGILYYQGESDGDRHPELYETLFPALIRCFRALWNEELPFLFVQLAPFGRWMACVGEPYAIIRAAQQHTADTVPGTGMAVITDIGMELDIHPKKKKPVGERLALLSESKVYGEDTLCEAPTLISAAVENNTLLLRFKNVGDGLTLADHTPDGAQTDPEKLGGLEIVSGGQAVCTDAVTAEAKEDTVTLKGVPLSTGGPVTVALGCTGWYRMNLYNSASLPVRPGKITVHLT